VQESDWLSFDDAARYLGLPKSILYTLLVTKTISCKKVRRKNVFEKVRLDDWLETAATESTRGQLSDSGLGAKV
jgi:excisionase family DNA binding protein